MVTCEPWQKLGERHRVVYWGQMVQTRMGSSVIAGALYTQPLTLTTLHGTTVITITIITAFNVTIIVTITTIINHYCHCLHHHHHHHRHRHLPLLLRKWRLQEGSQVSKGCRAWREPEPSLIPGQ